MKPTFAVGIPHADWVPERVAHLQHMLNAMGRRHLVGLHTHKLPILLHALYSEVVWKWLAEQDVTHCIFMSDDLELMPRFWDVLEAMVEAQPEHAIALDSLHPKGRQVLDSGGHWYRCKAWLAGPAMLIPKWMLIEHLTWRDRQTLKYIRETGDDSAFNEYLFQTNRDSWHPVPAPVDHNAELPTVKNGVVETVEKYRRPPVLWHGLDIDALCRVETWKTKTEPPFFKVPSEEERIAALQDSWRGDPTPMVSER